MLISKLDRIIAGIQSYFSATHYTVEIYLFLALPASGNTNNLATKNSHSW